MRLRIGIGMARMSTLCHKSPLSASYIIYGNAVVETVASGKAKPFRIRQLTDGEAEGDNVEFEAQPGQALSQIVATRAIPWISGAEGG
jgi:hypothetical protein